MCSQATQIDDEGLAKCREGEPEALAALREKYHTPLTGILRARGATETETEDLLADLWADCVPGGENRTSLLEKFSGRCTLQGWLATVATNRWLDLRRKQARRREVVYGEPEETGGIERLPAPEGWTPEGTLVELLKESLQSAFAACPPDAMVLLRLVYLHGLSQREVMHMLGWSESKVSRFLTRALKTIETHTLRELKRRDPWLQLSWQDLVDLCETHQVGFL